MPMFASGITTSMDFAWQKAGFAKSLPKETFLLKKTQ
jgi:hypothetical protein